MNPSRESGQALVESALTLPLTLFLILGTLQLFLVLQARTLAEYAVFRATRAGSLNLADCRVMTHTAIAALLPSFARTDSAEALRDAFRRYGGNGYTGGNGEAVVWLFKGPDRPIAPHIEESFDDQTDGASRTELVVELVFWFPLKIPFADRALSRIFLEARGVERARGSAEAAELSRRVAVGRYVVPLRTSFRMRMMTPALLMDQPCPNSPEAP